MQGSCTLGHVDQLRHFGADLGSRFLMDLIPVRRSEHFGVAGNESRGQGRDPGETPNHDVSGECPFEHGPCLHGGQLRGRHPDHRAQRGVDGDAMWQSLGGNQREATVNGCGDLVWMPLQLHGDSIYPIGKSILTDCPESGGGTRHECGGGRAQAFAERDFVVDIHRQGSFTHGKMGRNQRFAASTGRGTILSVVPDGPIVGYSRLDGAADPDRQSEAIESRTEVPRGRGGRSGSRFTHPRSLSTVPDVGDFLDIENLFPELILALGLALLIGNGLAWWKHRRGEVPEGVENAQYRPGRVMFLMGVGVLLTVWGAATLLT